MSVLSGDILSAREYDNSLEDYWAANQEDLLAHPTIEGLIKRQFEVLQRDNQLAYKLLCRMGCYRYQDTVATVPEDGIIAMLWEELKPRAKRIIKDLRDRCLIKFSDQDKGYFLHPVMREEAVSRLKASVDWGTANCKAAEFWLESISDFSTVMNALVGLEAYYHYREVKFFDSAAQVLFDIEKQNSNLKHMEKLAPACWRLGLLAQIISAINKVIDKINNSYYLSWLNLYLGYAYNLTGDINRAIECHRASYAQATDYLSVTSSNVLEYSSVQRVSMLYWANIGLAYLDLWELEEASMCFKEYGLQAHNLDARGYLMEADICLALVKSYLELKNEAYELTDKAYSQFYLVKQEMNSWGVGYGLIFLGKTYTNLREIERSTLIYLEAISYAEHNNYTQAKAKVLTGIAELYRIQQDFDTALSHHLESIELLDKIGAKCDLAEAYFQLGLTYQAMGEHDQAETYKAKALKLFGQMEAPKQIDRVNQAFEQGAQQ